MYRVKIESRLTQKNQTNFYNFPCIQYRSNKRILKEYLTYQTYSYWDRTTIYRSIVQVNVIRSLEHKRQNKTQRTLKTKYVNAARLSSGVTFLFLSR